MSKEEFINMIKQLDIIVIHDFSITFDDSSTIIQPKIIKYSVLEKYEQ